MAEQKQDGRPKKGGDKKKQENAPKPRRKSNYSGKHKTANVKLNLARYPERTQRAKEAATTHGAARLERRRLARLTAVEVAARARQKEASAVAAESTTEVAEPVADEGYAPTPFGHALARMDREAEQAGLFPERE